VTEADTTPVDAEYQRTHRWGLGEVAWGFAGGELASAVLFLVVAGLVGYKTSAEVPLWVLVVLQVPLWACMLGAVVYAARRKGTGLAADFGVSMKVRDVPIGIVVGLAGQLLLVPLVYWPIFKLFGHQDVSSAARDLTDKVHSSADTVALFGLVAIGAPIVEELFYRGLSQRSLLKQRHLLRANPGAAIVLTAVFFAASHFEFVQFPGLLAFGLVLGLMAWRTKRLGPGIWAHLTFNAIAAATLVWSWHIPGG
jgi:uncharacterized protein